MLEDNLNTELFENELKVIKSSREYISLGKYELEDLTARFSELILKYQKLLKLTRKIFRISDRQSVELKRREAEIKNLLDNSSQGFLTFGEDLIINKEYSAECHNIFARKIGGLYITELLAKDNPEMQKYLLRTFQRIYNGLPSPTVINELEKLPNQLWINDKVIQVHYKIVGNFVDYGQKPLMMVICTDITARHIAEEQIRFLSYHDKLTSLYNRAYIDSALQTYENPQYLPFSIIIGDMNGLKLTNDVFGHKAGDKLLVNMADVLRKCSRQGDIVGRWGGDEFIILLPQTNATSCQTLCTRIMEVCKNFKWDPIELSISLGRATSGSSRVDFTHLFREAENDMYARKSLESLANKNRIILSMEKILVSQCAESKEHVERIFKHVKELYQYVQAKQGDLQIPNKDTHFIHLLCKLHDVGKVAIEKELLREDQLTWDDEEYLKKHSEIGFRMAKALGEEEIASIIVSIHERWDGLGYPRGLKGEEIPLLSRILAVVHLFESLTSREKKPLDQEQALTTIDQLKGTELDPVVTDNFMEMIKKDKS